MSYEVICRGIWGLGFGVSGLELPRGGRDPFVFDV